MSLCYFSIQRSDNGKNWRCMGIRWDLSRICVMKSLCTFYRICLYKNYKKTERICTTGIADKREFFCLIFLLSLCFFIILLKTGYVTANLTDSFCSNNAFVSGNHSSCVVALEPLAKSKSRTAWEQYFANSVEGAGETDESIRGKQPKNSAK